MNEYNADARRLVPVLKPENSAHYVSPKGPEAIPEECRPYLGYYATADALAIFFKRRWDGAVRAIFFFTFLAVVSFATYAHLLDFAPILLLYPFLLAVAVALFTIVRLRGAERKYLEYRALAEAIRVQLFWAIAGIDEAAAEHYLRKQRTELDWIRNALRSLIVLAEAAPFPNLGFVKDHWVVDQAIFHRKAYQRDEHASQFFERAATALAILAVLAAVRLLVLEWPQAYQSFAHHEEEPFHKHLVWLAAVASIGTGVLLGFAKTKALSEQARQYSRMHSLFDSAAKKVEALLCLKKDTEVQQLIRELGEEALAENADWVVLHRARPIEVPFGG